MAPSFATFLFVVKMESNSQIAVAWNKIWNGWGQVLGQRVWSTYRGKLSNGDFCILVPGVGEDGFLRKAAPDLKHDENDLMIKKGQE